MFPHEQLSASSSAQVSHNQERVRDLGVHPLVAYLRSDVSKRTPSLEDILASAPQAIAERLLAGMICREYGG